MIGAIRYLLSLSVLLAAVQANILNANDLETCTALCGSCNGAATFVDGICKCSVREDDAEGVDCVRRLRRAADDVGLETAAENAAETAERSARCSLLGNRRRIASADADRVARYFMKGGPMTGTPLLGSAQGACASSPSDPLIGAVNLENAKPRPAETRVDSSPEAKSPAVAAAPSGACSSLAHNQYQPIVASSWIPAGHDASYNPMIGAPQAYHPSSFYPHMLGAIPHMVMAIPNALMTAATHIPRHHSPMIGAPQHSPFLSSLASGTHGVLQRLDKMVTPYASENHHNKMVGAPHRQSPDCGHSSSYPTSSMLGAAAPASATPAARADNSQINASMLQQALAHQNSLLEALSHQLQNLSPQVGAPRMLQYAPVAPGYMLGAPQPMGQYVSQPMSQYCPGGSEGSSSTVGSPRAADPPSKPAEASPKESEKVAASKVAGDKDSADDKVASSAADKKPASEKKTEETNKSEESESQKTKRETRTRSSNRKKRGGVKYPKNSEAVDPQV